MNEDIRWVQRFDNLKRAFQQLANAVNTGKERQLSDLEKQGLIQGFEFTHELAWKTLKDFIESRGNAKLFGSKDATREAFQMGLIEKGEVWMEMIRSRNESSHTYNLEVAERIADKIQSQYFPAIQSLIVELEKIEK